MKLLFASHFYGKCSTDIELECTCIRHSFVKMTSAKGVSVTVTQLKESLGKEFMKMEKEKAVNTQLSSKFYERCLDILQRLDDLQIDLPILKSTLIGTAVSKFKNCPEEEVARTAKLLVKKWKKIAKMQSVEGTVDNVKPVLKVTTKTPPIVTVKQEPVTSNNFPGLPKLRQNMSEKLYGILCNKEFEESVRIEKTSEIENEIQKCTRDISTYKDKCRSLLFNLKRNASLRTRLLSGDVSASRLMKMTSAELATEEKVAARKKIVDEVQDSRLLDWEASNEDKINEQCGITGDLLNASLFTCKRCNSTKTTSTQKQTRSADEPMTVFVFCMNCGNRWKC